MTTVVVLNCCSHKNYRHNIILLCRICAIEFKQILQCTLCTWYHCLGIKSNLMGVLIYIFICCPLYGIAEMVMQLLVLLINGKHLCFTWKAEAAGKHVCHQKRCWEILCKLTIASSLLKKHLRARSINTQQIQTFQRIASSWQTEGKKNHEGDDSTARIQTLIHTCA